MIEKISEMIKDAMRAKAKGRLDALRYMKSMLLENKTSVKPIGELEVLIKHHKKMVDSKEFYKEKPEKIEILDAEIKVIEEFLPKQLIEADVVEMIAQIKGSLETPNMGMIMKQLTPQIKGKFNGKRASEMVKESLS